MSRAPSSGVSSLFSTEVRPSWIKRPDTCHFGSIVRPKSVGFIEANWWTRDGVTVSAIAVITPLGSDTGTPPGCQSRPVCQTEVPLLAETRDSHFAKRMGLTRLGSGPFAFRRDRSYRLTVRTLLNPVMYPGAACDVGITT